MKLDKIIALGIIICSVIVSANAVGTAPNKNNTELYYEMENSSIIDNTPNNNDGTDSGTGSGTGIINNARTFDGSTSYIDSTYSVDIGINDEIALCSWGNTDDVSAGQRNMVGTLKEAGTNDPIITLGIGGIVAGEPFTQFKADNGNTYTLDYNTVATVDTWSYYCVVLDRGTDFLYYYVDGVLRDSIAVTGTDTFSLAGNSFFIGSANVRGSASTFWSGSIDEVSIYNYSLNQSHIDYLYQLGAPGQEQQWDFSFFPTPIITIDSNTVSDFNLYNSTFNRYYTQTNLTITTNLSVTNTNSNVNGTYTLYDTLNATFIETDTQYITNSLNGTLNVVLPYDSLFKWNATYFNNETSTTDSGFFIMSDTVAPNISVIGNITQDTFFVDFSTIFNVTDSFSGVDSCTINITYLEANESDSNFFINCTDTQIFTRAGLYNGFLEAIDRSGNINTLSVNGSINPLVYIFFNDTVTNTTVLTYDATIYHPDGRVTFPVVNVDGSINLSPVNEGELDLGVHTIMFEKLGFSTGNFSVNITVTSGGENITFNVTRSTIVLSIFDRETEELLTGLSTVTLVATVGFNSTTTTGLLNITDINFVPGNYQIIVSHSNYTTESVFFVYDNQETLNVEVSLLNITATQFGTVTVNAIADTGQLIQGAVCRALEWMPSTSSYVTVAEGLTNINGNTILNIELNIKLYKFSCSKSGETITTNQQIIPVSGTTVPITMPTGVDIPIPSLLQATGQLVNTTLNSTHQLLTFTYSDSAGLVTQGCIKIFKKVGARLTFMDQTCSASSQGEIFYILNINQTYDIEARGTLKQNDITNKVDTILFKTVRNLETALKNYGIDILIPLLFFFLGISVGFMIKPNNIMISLFGGFGGVWGAQLLVSSIVSQTIAIVISVILLFIGWGVNRR